MSYASSVYTCVHNLGVFLWFPMAFDLIAIASIYLVFIRVPNLTVKQEIIPSSPNAAINSIMCLESNDNVKSCHRGLPKQVISLHSSFEYNLQPNSSFVGNVRSYVLDSLA